MHRVQRHLLEQKSGAYNFNDMYASVQRGDRDLDVATYIGPVEVKASEGRGRGLFTTRAVKASELLICEKAFVYCRAAMDMAKVSSYINILVYPKEQKVILGAECDVITMAIQKIFRNPSFVVDAAKFYCGAYQPVSVTGLVDGQPVVDLFVIFISSSHVIDSCPCWTRNLDAFSFRSSYININELVSRGVSNREF